MDENIVENADSNQASSGDLSENKISEKQRNIKKTELNSKSGTFNQKLINSETLHAGKNPGANENDSQNDGSNIDFLMDIPLAISVELGRAKMFIKDLIQIEPNSIIELDKSIGEPLDLLVNDKPIARGEVVVFDENLGIRITDIIKPEDRIKSLR